MRQRTDLSSRPALTKTRLTVALGVACGFAALGASCAGSSQTDSAAALARAVATTKLEVVQASEIEWGALNPARGDASPRAATLWGSRMKNEGPTGFLVRFKDGFSSPPHIHNITYRGVVIDGLVHNDDPNADAMWMPPGSFWTQPKGAAHITSARGGETFAFIEIEEGPYLVHPTEEAFESPEQPVNLDASNRAWASAPRIGWSAPGGVADALDIALLWGDALGDGLGGLFVRLKPNASATLHSPKATFRAVVIQGQPKLDRKGGAVAMAPGAHMSAIGGGAARVACGADQSCLFYVRAEGAFRAVGTP